MSSKSTIFLTDDWNEHCYEDCSQPNFDSNKNYIGDTITIEMAKENISVVCNDIMDLVVEIKPGCELYQYISKLKDASI